MAYQHLYLYGNDGKLIRALTPGEFMVVGATTEAAVRAVDEHARRVYFTANLPSPVERQLYWVSLDRPARPLRVTAGAGTHDITMSMNARVFVDRFSNVDTPPNVTLRRANGEPLTELVPNKLDAAHPYAPFVDEHVEAEFGTLAAADGQLMYYELLKPRVLEPGKRYPVLVDVYGGPGVQRVTNAWGNLFHQYLAQHGYVVFTLDNRGSGFRGTKFETALGQRDGRNPGAGPGAGRGIPAQPAVRGRQAHRHLRLELRRLHDTHVPDAGARRLRGRRRRRARDRLDAVRHALHRALSIYSAGRPARIRGEQRAQLRGASCGARCC